MRARVSPTPGRRHGVGFRAVAAGLAVGLLVPMALPVAAADDPATDDGFVAAFEQAAPDTGAMFRWWWPAGAVDEDEIRSELDAIAAAGYKGVEIADVRDSVAYEIDPDPVQVGSDAWMSAVQAAAEYGQELGLQVDLTMGARWPIAVPGLDVDGPASSKELTFGLSEPIGADGYQGDIPQPQPRTYENRTSDGGVYQVEELTSTPSFMSLVAYRLAAEPAEEGPLMVDVSSTVDLTGDVSDGTIDWTPPDDGSWVLASFWERGTGQRNDAPFGSSSYIINDPEARVVDHLSATGTQAFLDWFATIVTDETIAALSASGGSVFEDSLELRGNPMWTDAMGDEFQSRRGYDLTPYLGFLVSVPGPSPFAPPSQVFAAADDGAAVVDRVQYDFDQTMSDLYFENHVAPLEAWASERGLTYRAQPYGLAIDMGLVGSKIDIVEDEALRSGAGDEWRLMATGADLAGEAIVSDEMIPGGFGGSYKNTPAAIAREVNSHYAVGASQMVFHGFPYAEWPESIDGTVTDSAALWPGFHGFTPNIPDAFGPRNPTWTMEPTVAGYYARAQRVLQSGSRLRDVAVYTQSFDGLGEGIDGTPLLDAGYSYGYVTPGSLGLDVAVVEDGVLASAGPAFGAVLVADQASMPLEAAQRLLEYADAGLPIVFVGAPPQTVAGYAASADDAAVLDAELASVIESILGMDSAVSVDSLAAVPAALEGLGVTPRAVFAEPGLRTLVREDGDVTFVFAFNPSEAAAEGTITVQAAGVPYALDAWTGAIEPVTAASDGDAVTVDVSLEAGEARFFAIAPEGWLGHDAEGGEMAESTADAPAPIELPTWNLTVDAWGPGEADAPSSATSHTEYSFDQMELAPWSGLADIGDVSGIGTYSSTVGLDASWEGIPVTLELGEVNGSFDVLVNGQSLAPLNQLDTSVDLDGLLSAGENTIEVVVATNLVNALRVHRPDEYGEQEQQAYGLIGPVTIEAS